jgi:EPS-associated MarR family transcriptional regulator
MAVAWQNAYLNAYQSQYSNPMNPKLTSQDEIQLKVLRMLHEQPELSQRNIAKELGVSLGGINYCFKALVEKGWIKLENFSASKHKLGYIYVLTPSGVKSKSILTVNFLKKKLLEYEQISDEINVLKAEAAVLIKLDK